MSIATTVTPELATGTDRRRDRIVGAAQALVGLYALWAFGLGSRTPAGRQSTFGLTYLGGHGTTVPNLVVPARGTAVALGVVCVIAGLARALVVLDRRLRLLGTTVYLVAFVVAFLVWAAAGHSLNVAGGLLYNTLLVAVPLILGSMSGVLCERSGVINIAIEGQFLVGACAAAFSASVSGSLWIGLAAGVVAGGLVGALLAVLSQRYLIEQVVLGVVINLFASGLTGFFYDRLMQSDSNHYNNPPVFGTIRIPLLADIPVIGAVLFNENIIVYATYVLIAVVHVWLFKTRWGLRTRAVGEHPTAADTMGINVLRVRYRNVILGGLLAGLGGVWLTIGQVGSFNKDMSSGKGYIALAALIFGRWSPLGSLAAALVFGFAGAITNTFSSLATPIPSSFLAMAPYLATIFAVAGLVGRVRAPAADGQPYQAK